MKKEGIKKIFKKINWNALFVSFVAVYATALLGGLFTSKGLASLWYQNVRPSITPPGWVFSVAWNILFFLIFISLYLCIKDLKALQKRKWPSSLELAFSINLILNFLWCFFYFWLQNPLIAFIDLILLWTSIIVIICLTWKSNRISALLLIPYLLWISFAGVLNYLSILLS
jgi:tryptophan-rich sensory protein